MALYRGAQGRTARFAGQVPPRPQFDPEMAQVILNELTPAQLRELALRQWSGSPNRLHQRGLALHPPIVH